MTIRPRFRRGTWKVQCERSGIIANAEDMVEEWNGRIVYKDFYEERHPQELITTPPDHESVPFQRPATGTTNDRSLGIGVWTVEGTWVIVPDEFDKDTNPVGFENWYNSTYNEVITS